MAVLFGVLCFGVSAQQMVFRYVHPSGIVMDVTCVGADLVVSSCGKVLQFDYDGTTSDGVAVWENGSDRILISADGRTLVLMDAYTGQYLTYCLQGSYILHQ